MVETIASILTICAMLTTCWYLGQGIVYIAYAGYLAVLYVHELPRRTKNTLLLFAGLLSALLQIFT